MAVIGIEKWSSDFVADPAAQTSTFDCQLVLLDALELSNPAARHRSRAAKEPASSVAPVDGYHSKNTRRATYVTTGATIAMAAASPSRIAD